MVRILWFRKNLRISDNRVLKVFLDEINPGDRYLFLYIKNKNTFRYFGKKRVHFLNQCLDDLKNQLKDRGFNLHIFKGDSLNVFKQIIQSDTKVYADRQIEPYCITRDERTEDFLRTMNSELITIDDSTLFESGEVLKPDGKPYTVFTPFRKRCELLLGEKHWSEESCDFAKPATCKEYKTNAVENYEYLPNDEGFVKGGRTEGLILLKSFERKGIEKYNTLRDFPAENGTSRLSPHLHFGTVSIRECYRAALGKLETAEDKEEVRTWINELLWREFYYNISCHFPYLIDGAFKRQYDRIKWSYDEDLFEKWREGKTGYPLVDAGMRQLVKEGWMHNRLRMITAMFLTKDLFIDWKLGEKFFAEHLIDLDFSSNNGGWQWSASTGCDAQPYFRIFNPYLQSAKFDPEGKYIKHYVPELKSVPPKYIHNPSLMPDEMQNKLGVVLGRDYPLPVVEHSKAKDRIMIEFRSL